MTRPTSSTQTASCPKRASGPAAAECARSTHRRRGRTTRGRRTRSSRRAHRRGVRSGHRRSPSRCGLPAQPGRTRREAPRPGTPEMGTEPRSALDGAAGTDGVSAAAIDALGSAEPGVEGVALQPASTSPVPAPARREPSSGHDTRIVGTRPSAGRVSLGAGSPRWRSRCLPCRERRRTNPGRAPPTSSRRPCRRARTPSAGSLRRS